MDIATVRRGLSALRAHVSTPADVSLAVRMLGWALLLPALKSLLPLPRLVRLVYRGGRRARCEKREQQIASLTRWIHRPLVPRDRGCLQRSLLAYRFLSEADADPHLFVGVRKEGNIVLGHAWVVVDGQPIGESWAAVRGYVPVIAFGAGGLPRELSVTVRPNPPAQLPC